MTGITYNGELLINYSLRHGKLYGPSGKELKVTDNGKVRITIKGERKSAVLDDIIKENNVSERKAAKKGKKNVGNLRVDKPKLFNPDLVDEKDRLIGDKIAETADEELLEFVDSDTSKYMPAVRSLQKKLDEKGVCNSDFLTKDLLDEKSINRHLYEKGDQLLGDDAGNFNMSAAAIAFCVEHNISAVILSDTPEMDKNVATSIAVINSLVKERASTLIYSAPVEGTDLAFNKMKILTDGEGPFDFSARINTFLTLPSSVEATINRERGSFHPYQFIFGLDQLNHPDIILAGSTFKIYNKPLENSARIILGELHNIGYKLEGALNDYRNITFEALLDFSEQALEKIADSKEIIVLKIVNNEKVKVDEPQEEEITFESKLEWYTDSEHIPTASVLLSGLEEFPGGWAAVVTHDMDRDELPQSLRSESAYRSYLTRHILEVLTTGPIFDTSKLYPTVQDTLFAIFGMNNMAAIQSLLEQDLVMRDKYDRLLSDVIAIFCDNTQLLSSVKINAYVADFIGGKGIDPVKLVRALQIKHLFIMLVERKEEEAKLNK